MRECVVELLKEEQRVRREEPRHPLDGLVRARRRALRDRPEEVHNLFDLLEVRQRERVVDRPGQPTMNLLTVELQEATHVRLEELPVPTERCRHPGDDRQHRAVRAVRGALFSWKLGYCDVDVAIPDR